MSRFLPGLGAARDVSSAAAIGPKGGLQGRERCGHVSVKVFLRVLTSCAEPSEFTNS